MYDENQIMSTNHHPHLKTHRNGHNYNIGHQQFSQYQAHTTMPPNSELRRVQPIVDANGRPLVGYSENSQIQECGHLNALATTYQQQQPPVSTFYGSECQMYMRPEVPTLAGDPGAVTAPFAVTEAEVPSYHHQNFHGTSVPYDSERQVFNLQMEYISAQQQQQAQNEAQISASRYGSTSANSALSQSQTAVGRQQLQQPLYVHYHEAPVMSPPQHHQNQQPLYMSHNNVTSYGQAPQISAYQSPSHIVSSQDAIYLQEREPTDQSQQSLYYVPNQVNHVIQTDARHGQEQQKLVEGATFDRNPMEDGLNSDMNQPPMTSHDAYSTIQHIEGQHRRGLAVLGDDCASLTEADIKQSNLEVPNFTYGELDRSSRSQYQNHHHQQMLYSEPAFVSNQVHQGQSRQQQQISQEEHPSLSEHPTVNTSPIKRSSETPSRRRKLQEQFIDMKSSGSISQDWLDNICRHMNEHMNRFGICVIDNFLGSIKGEMILSEVTQLYDSGQYSKGKLVKDGLASPVLGDSSSVIRSDRVIWIDGCENGCAEINNLIQTLCSVITNSSRLALYSNKGLDKVVINKRTKAHVACYPGNGTRYIKHVDNPNGDGRVITSIYYPNKDWNTKRDGGLLRMFPAGMNEIANIEPLFDRALFFWSDRRNPHEVLPAYKDRYAITVWYIGEDRP